MPGILACGICIMLRLIVYNCMKEKDEKQIYCADSYGFGDL